jgi:hypothetical protein
MTASQDRLFDLSGAEISRLRSRTSEFLGLKAHAFASEGSAASAGLSVGIRGTLVDIALVKHAARRCSCRSTTGKTESVQDAMDERPFNHDLEVLG